MSKRKPAGYWTKERCATESLKHNSRSAWKRHCSGSYCKALDSGWLDEICSHMSGGRKPNGYWSLERCIQEAKKYSSQKEWAQKSRGSFSSAYNKGFMDQCTEHMERLTGKSNAKWTKRLCIEDAKRFDYRHEWELASPGYQAARKKGWLAECCSHMDYSDKATDADVVYLWEEVSTGLYKIGVTSARIGDKRIKVCLQRNKMEALIKFMVRVPDAYSVESKLLELGTDPELDSSIDGYTEFRRLTDAELGQAVSIAYEAALAA